MRTLAQFVTKAHKTIIIAWITIFAVMAVFAIRLPGLLEGDGFQNGRRTCRSDGYCFRYIRYAR